MSYWQPLGAKTAATRSVPHPENECQQSVYNCVSWIVCNQCIAQILEQITELMTTLISKHTIYQRKYTDSKIIDIANCNRCNTNYWLLNMRFWYDIIIILPQQEPYMNPWMDPLGDPLTTSPIQKGWEIFFKMYPSQRFGGIGNQDGHFGNGFVRTQTQTRSDRPEMLLALIGTTQGNLSAHLAEMETPPAVEYFR